LSYPEKSFIGLTSKQNNNNTFHIFIVGERRDFKFAMQVDHRNFQPTGIKLSLKGAWSRHMTRF